MKRKGFTLLELIVIFGILSVLLLLFGGAIQKARMAVGRVQCLNHLKQIGIATLLTMDKGEYNYYESQNGKPTIYTPHDLFIKNLGYQNSWIDYQAGTFQGSRVSVLLCPADSTANAVPPTETNPNGSVIPTIEYLYSTSYRGNALVFNSTKKFPQGISDGLSNTIGLIECNTFLHKLNDPINYLFQVGILFSIKNHSQGDLSYEIVPSKRGAVFAHKGYFDVYPVRSPNGETTSSAANVTFLDGMETSPLAGPVPVSPHNGGIQIAMLDGSAKWITKGIAPHVFWATVTPDWGD